MSVLAKIANPGGQTAAYLEGRDEEILHRRMRDDRIKERIVDVFVITLEDVKAGIVRGRKKRTFSKQLFAYGYQGEVRIVSK